MSKLFKTNQRIISFLLLVIICITTLIHPLQVEASLSKDVQMTYIGLMSNEKSKYSLSDAQLTAEDLRILGIYASNAYIPMVTTLNQSDANSENYNNTINNMSELLKIIGYDEDVAKALSKTTIALSYNTAKRVYIRESDLTKYAPKWFFNSKNLSGVSASDVWFDFEAMYKSTSYQENADAAPINLNGEQCYCLTLGGLLSLCNYIISSQAYEDNGGYVNPDASRSVRLDSVSFVHIMTKDDSIPLLSEEGKVVADINLNTCTKLAYAFTYIVKNSGGNASKGLTSNALLQTDSTAAYFGVADDQDDAIIRKDQVKLNLSFQKLWVDCFGNIIVDLGENQVVLLPASMNDRVFSDSNDTTYPKMNFLSIQSLRMLSYLSSNIGKTVTIASDGKSVNFDSVESKTTSTSTNKLKASGTASFYSKSSNLYGSLPLTMLRGDSSSVTGDLNIGSIKKSSLSQYFTDFVGKDVYDPGALNREANVVSSYVRMPSFAKRTFTDSDAYLVFITDTKITDKKAKTFSITTSRITDNIVSKMQDGLSDSFGMGSDSYMTINGGENGGEKLLAKYIFYSYIMSCADELPAGAEEFTMKLNQTSYPAVDPNAMSLLSDYTDSISEDSIDTEIKSFIYYLLHPTKGLAYIAKLIKNKLGALLISAHEDIVGNTNSNVSTGMTKYLNTSSYITTPTLKDISFLNYIVNCYDVIIIFIIILIMIILICYIIIGQMTVWQGIVGLLSFSILSLLPPLIIATSLTMSNNICDKIYSQKFQYWSVVQLLQYLDLSTAESSASNTQEYIEAMINNAAELEDGETAGFGGTKLKWMSPKQFTSYADFYNDVSNVKGLTDTMATWMTSAASHNNTEEFLETDNAEYIYRDIIDIYKYAAYGYAMGSDWLDASIKCSNNKEMTVANAINGSDTASSLHGYELVTDLYDGTTNQNTQTLNLASCSYNDLVRANTPDTNFKSIGADYIEETSSIYAINNGFLFDVNNGTTIQNYWLNSNTRASNLFINFCSELPQIQRTTKTLNSWRNATLNLSIKNLKQKKSDIGYYSMYPSDVTPKGSYLTKRCNYYLLGQLPLYQMDADSLYNIGVGSSESNTIYGRLPAKSWAYEELSMYYYELYSESPYFYFYNNIKDQVTSYCTEYDYNVEKPNSSKGNLYQLFLDKNYFKNYKTNNAGYGELRDFMNMHDLFYYVMPVLKAGNDNLFTFVESYGLELYEDCPLHYDVNTGELSYIVDNQKFSTTFYGTSHSARTTDAESVAEDNDASESDTSDYKNYGIIALLRELDNAGIELSDQDLYEIWHNYNIMYLYNFYSSWASYMANSDYAKGETITVNGEKVMVGNPLDPTSYFYIDKNGEFHGRYMIFSRSEMAYYGLSEYQLTKVERKILEIQDTVYEKTLDLMNYYTLSDEALIGNYAYIQLFAFNSAFSQTSLISEDYIIYPQAFEAKAFTYDTYLRMVLANSSDKITLMSDDNSSIYRRIISNTSIFFGVFLLLNDLISVYAIPLIRLVIITLLLIVSILIIIANAINLEFSFSKVLGQSLIAPLFSYIGITIGMAYILSLFMGQMAKGVEVTTQSISLGDPTTTLIAMILINAAVFMLYFKVVKKLIADFKTYFKAIADNMISAVAGAFQKMTKSFKGAQRTAAGLGTSVANRSRQNTSGRNAMNDGFAAGLASGMLGGVAGATALNSFDKAGQEEERANIDAAKQAERAEKDAARAKRQQHWDERAFTAENAEIDKHNADIDKANQELRDKNKAMEKENAKYAADMKADDYKLMADKARQQQVKTGGLSTQQEKASKGRDEKAAQRIADTSQKQALRQRKINRNNTKMEQNLDQIKKNEAGKLQHKSKTSKASATFRKVQGGVIKAARTTSDVATKTTRVVSDVGRNVGNAAYTVSHPIQAATKKNQARALRGAMIRQQQQNATN